MIQWLKNLAGVSLLGGVVAGMIWGRVGEWWGCGVGALAWTIFSIFDLSLRG